jgi:DNA-binding MarR family transcriptional regulator
MLNIARTDAVLSYSIIEALKPFDITPTQYNVLRILRGAGHDGLCREDIRERLVAQVPDVTRLLDRLVQAGLVERARDKKDRRLVNTRITHAGLDLLKKLDAPVNAAHEKQLGHLTKTELRTLIELLAKAREKENGNE